MAARLSCILISRMKFGVFGRVLRFQLSAKVADNVTPVEINVNAPTLSDVYILLHVDLQNGGFEDSLLKSQSEDAGFEKLDKPSAAFAASAAISLGP